MGLPPRLVPRPPAPPFCSASVACEIRPVGPNAVLVFFPRPLGGAAMEAALTLPPTNMVAAGLCRCVRPSQRSLRCRAAQLSQEIPTARRCRCHFLPALSPTTSTAHPPRPTDQPDRTRRASPVRCSDRSSHSACATRHPLMHSPRLTALPRPPHAHLPLLHACAVSRRYVFPPPTCMPLRRAWCGIVLKWSQLRLRDREPEGGA